MEPSGEPLEPRRRVGTVNVSYNSRRNFLDHDIPGFTYVRTFDLLSAYRYATRLSSVRRLIQSRTLDFLHCDFGLNSCDLLHFFNHVSVTTTPWVVTYETSVPRWGSGIRLGLRLLARENCRKLIAMSHAARDIQLRMLRLYPRVSRAIADKITVVHPPQAPVVERWANKGVSHSGELVFAFVGGDFFRKGGSEILRVFQRLFDEGEKVRLVIVSELRYGDYASRATRQDREWSERTIARYADRIEYHRRLPNEEVLKILTRSHVALLPSYGDTFGYSVLEAQACACPVITTDIRALPEINDPTCGWLIDVPKTESRDGVLGTAAERSRFSRIVEAGLYRTIREILRNPAMIEDKGEAALARIRSKHDPRAHATRLASIYREALA